MQMAKKKAKKSAKKGKKAAKKGKVCEFC